jgi:hypothetical protein
MAGPNYARLNCEFCGTRFILMQTDNDHKLLELKHCPCCGEEVKWKELIDETSIQDASNTMIYDPVRYGIKRYTRMLDRQ